MQQDSNLFTGMKFDYNIRNIIKQTASWAMIIVTVNVIGYIISLIAAFTGNEPAIISAQEEGFTSTMFSGGSSKSTTVFSVLVGLVINYFLFKFGTLANASVKSGTTEELGNAFRHMKIFFAITSVIMIIVLVIIVFAMIGASFRG